VPEFPKVLIALSVALLVVTAVQAQQSSTGSKGRIDQLENRIRILELKYRAAVGSECNAGSFVKGRYAYLFAGSTLQDLPDQPRFVINATNVQSGVLWRFSKPYMWDYRVGKVKNPSVPLARAVAASSAFPPVLSPFELRLDPDGFIPKTRMDLQREPFTSRIILTDGGVHDNLGLETAWKRYEKILVSDDGGQFEPEEEPKSDWARHSYRVLMLIDNQVSALRKRQLIDAYLSGVRSGAYWGIRTNISDYGLANPLPCPVEQTVKLAETPTRLKRLDGALQERLINWGYAVCDATLRRHVDPDLPKPSESGAMPSASSYGSSSRASLSCSPAIPSGAGSMTLTAPARMPKRRWSIMHPSFPSTPIS
jgi:NTE family protein